MTTAAEIRAEHDAAIASMSPAQAAAVTRLLDATTMARFPGATCDRRLAAAFDSEARNSAAAPPS